MSELIDVGRLYNRFYGGNEDSITALAEISGRSTPKQTQILLLANLMKLWDEFDADVKDLIIAAMMHFPHKETLSEIPKLELERDVFSDANRRRLLRSEEIRKLFPQLDPPSANYAAVWHPTPVVAEPAKTLAWLQQHNLGENPFGYDMRLYPFFPKGAARPEGWSVYVSAGPQIGVCPTSEDLRTLAVLLRDECLSARQIFPILVSLRQEDPTQPALVTLARAAVETWLDILARSPGILLDLPLNSQKALLEMLFWAVGVKEIIENILEKNGLKENTAGGVLKRKITEFESHIPATQLPQDQVLLAWLGIRPPDLQSTSLIVCMDAVLPAQAWYERFNPFVPVLLRNQIVTEALTSAATRHALSLPETKLSWSVEQLGKSLESQFNAAMEMEASAAGKATTFHELFGPGATEEETTQRLLTASRHSLARMLTLGNRLVQKHCEADPPEKFLSPKELDEILKSA